MNWGLQAPLCLGLQRDATSPLGVPWVAAFAVYVRAFMSLRPVYRDRLGSPTKATQLEPGSNPRPLTRETRALPLRHTYMGMTDPDKGTNYAMQCNRKLYNFGYGAMLSFR